MLILRGDPSMILEVLLIFGFSMKVRVSVLTVTWVGAGVLFEHRGD